VGTRVWGGVVWVKKEWVREKIDRIHKKPDGVWTNAPAEGAIGSNVGNLGRGVKSRVTHGGGKGRNLQFIQEEKIVLWGEERFCGQAGKRCPHTRQAHGGEFP